MSNSESCEIWRSCVEGDFPTGSSSEFKDHLADCESCRRQFARWQQLELETLAACLLFGQTSDVNEQSEPSGEPGWDAPYFDLPSRHAEGEIGEFRPRSRRMKLIPARTIIGITAAVLLTIGVLGYQWIQLDGRNGLVTASSDEPTRQAPLSAAKNLLSSTTHKIRVRIDAPHLATTPRTTDRYTFVKVFPIFEERRASTN
jgi:hypothetical protein